MVLTLQEPSFMAAGDMGQRKTHPHTPSYCLGTGMTRAYGQSPAPDRDHMGSWQLLGHTAWRNPAAVLPYMWEPLTGFIPFATVSSQTTIAISSYLQQLKSCYQGLTGAITSSECFSDGHQNAKSWHSPTTRDRRRTDLQGQIPLFQLVSAWLSTIPHPVCAIRQDHTPLYSPFPIMGFKP